MCTWGGHTYAWASPQILGLIGAAVVLGLAFVLNEAKASQPVIPLSLFKDRNFTLTTIAALLIGVAMFGAAVTLILLLFVEEKPLATSVEQEITAESLAEGQLAPMELDDEDAA